MVVEYWLGKFDMKIVEVKETEKQYRYKDKMIYRKIDERIVLSLYGYRMFEVVSGEPNQFERMCETILNKYIANKNSNIEYLNKEIAEINSAYANIDFTKVGE